MNRRKMGFDPNRYYFPGERRAMRRGRKPTEDDIFCPFDEKDVDFTPAADFDPENYFRSQGYDVISGREEDMPDKAPFAPEPERDPYAFMDTGDTAERRVACVKDGMRLFLPKIIIGAILLLSLIPIISTAVNNIRQDIFFSNAASVKGHVVELNMEYGGFYEGGLTAWNVTYEYTPVAGKTVHSSDRITPAEAKKLSISFDGAGDANMTDVTVYYDVNAPASSQLTMHKKSVAGMNILCALFGSFVFGWGIIELIMFRGGRYCIETRVGRETIRLNKYVRM